DLSVPLAIDTSDFGLPVKTFVVELLHLFDTAHELRESFELRPLVICGAKRHIDFDGLLNSAHQIGSLVVGFACRPSMYPIRHLVGRGERRSCRSTWQIDRVS